MSEISTPKIARYFNILSLDGGGVRGTFAAIIVRRLLEAYPKLLREADLLTGVSTGGIQALGLAAGITPPALVDLYEKCAKFVFKGSFFDNAKDLCKLSGANYDNTNLKSLLQMQFGDMRLGELDKKVAIPAFNLDNGAPDPTERSWKLKVYHNFESNDSDSEESVVDVALKTSAVPTYFPTHNGFADGGLVVTNPSLIGLAQALDLRGPGRSLSEISLLSIGTGKVNRFIEGKDLDWGIAQWAPHLLYILLEAGAGATDFQCKTILRDKYFRINEVLKATFILDAWKKVPQISKLANEYPLEPSLKWLEANWV